METGGKLALQRWRLITGVQLVVEDGQDVFSTWDEVGGMELSL